MSSDVGGHIRDGRLDFHTAPELCPHLCTCNCIYTQHEYELFECLAVVVCCCLLDAIVKCIGLISGRKCSTSAPAQQVPWLLLLLKSKFG